jgi:hypothetical protein
MAASDAYAGLMLTQKLTSFRSKWPFGRSVRDRGVGEVMRARRRVATPADGTVKLTRDVDHGRHDHPGARRVAPEAIGDEAPGDMAAPLEQLAKEPRGGVAIPAGLGQDVDDLGVLVDGPPKVLTLATNRHGEFVEMPRVADRSGPMSKPPGAREAEGLAPGADGFVRDGDATVREEVFDVAEAQGEAVVEPDGVADDGGRKSVARIADDLVGI